MKFEDYRNDQLNAVTSCAFGEISAIADMIKECSERKGIVWTAGNGGSATTAAHLATDLSKGCYVKKGRQYPSICLNESLGTSTAWANDFSYESSLSRMLRSVARDSDMVICISGSGNSSNILTLVEEAKSLNITFAYLTGMGGGMLAKVSPNGIIVNSNNMQVIENTHLYIVHSIYNLLN